MDGWFLASGNSRHVPPLTAWSHDLTRRIQTAGGGEGGQKHTFYVIDPVTSESFEGGKVSRSQQVTKFLMVISCQRQGLVYGRVSWGH